MNFAFGFPVAAINAPLTWYGLRSSMRSPHFAGGSPRDTHTSV
jgi:hypothetical protein